MSALSSLSDYNDVHAFWAERWSGPKLGWHKDAVNPHLERHAGLLLGDSDCGDGGARVFVPLCGKSVDLAYLATYPGISHIVGVDVVRDAAVDFAAEHPLLSMEELPADGSGAGHEARSAFRGNNLTILVRDLFDLLPMDDDGRAECLFGGIPPAPPARDHLFDAVYDRASLVAVKPSQREDYAALMGGLLKPGGAVLLVSLDRRKTATKEAKGAGPPFSVDEAEVRRLYESEPWVDSVTLLDEVNDLKSDEDKKRWEKKGVLELYETVFLIRKKT